MEAQKRLANRRRVYIAYGAMEGPLQANKMKRALIKHGYEVTGSQTDADIVIAHSGGHLEINDPSRFKQILLIDPAFPNNRPIPLNWLLHLLETTRLVFFSKDWPFFFQTLAINLWYILFDVKRSKSMYSKYSNSSVQKFNLKNVTITSSSDPTWRDKDLPKLQKVIHFRASHQDCWLHPSKYLDLLV